VRVYQLLAKDLRAQILRGDFSGGRRLPTEAALAGEYQISRQTVRRAFMDLVAESLVYRVPGRGTFAQPDRRGYMRQVGSVDDLMGLSSDTAMRVIRPLTRKIDLVAAGRLRVASDIVYEMQFVRLHEGTPFCLTSVCLPQVAAKCLATVKELHTVAAESTLTLIALLDARLECPIAEAQQSITVESADGETAAALGCPVGHATLRVDRVYLDTNGDGVELATSYFLPEQYSYRISLRRSG
jgi:DNA-binding GntR family transcriptional regulator